LSFDACSGADQGSLRAGEHRGKMIGKDSTTRPRRWKIVSRWLTMNVAIPHHE
jgi:hypothetical protein